MLKDLLLLLALAAGTYGYDVQVHDYGSTYVTENQINEEAVEHVEDLIDCVDAIDISKCPKCGIAEDYEKRAGCGYVSCVCVENEDGRFGGDMMLTDTTRNVINKMFGKKSGSGFQARGLTNREELYWPGSSDGKVYIPYIINGLSASHRQKITEAIQVYHARTCIRYVPRSTQKDFIKFAAESKDGCFSYVGRIGNGQLLNLGERCNNKGVIIHEMMHALGFFHEQSRPDRDQYVSINYNNIFEGRESNFDKQERSAINSLNSPYDYRSIMHYSAYAFTRNGQKTIVVKNSNVEIGQRETLSDEDEAQINNIYCGGGSGGGVTTTTPSQTRSTTRRTPTTTPSTVGCVNINSDANCEYWKSKNYCVQTFQSYMEKNCRKSCGKCIGKETVNGCINVYGDKCDMFKSFCTDTRFRPWMKQNCRRSCGGCADSETTTTTAVSKTTRAASVAVTSEACGTASQTDQSYARIVGGVEAKQGAHPWQVSLRFGPSNAPICGASLIAKQWVLTAAHCVKERFQKSYTVFLGLHKKYPTGNDHVSIKIEKVIVHESYNKRNMENDIALLKLAEPVQYTNFIRPVCLADTSNDARSSSLVTVSGWGDTGKHRKRDEAVLQKVDLTLQPNDRCNEWIKMKNAKLSVTKDMLCAGESQGKKDSCQGDSGGPLVYKAFGSTTHYQIGIVSWGLGCAKPKQPGVYTKVSSYRDWIDSKMGNE